MVRALEAGRAAGWTLYIGPLGLPWDGVDPPPRAATFPAVTLDRAARQLARTAAAAPPAAASAAPPTGGARRWGPLVDRVAREEGIDPALIRAVVATESAYRPTAVSPKGAAGLMQLMPATAARFGLTPEERFDPERNVRAGIRYLRWLLARFDGDLELALAGYNAGEGAVLRYGRQIPPFEETQDYVRRVARHRARYAAAEGAGTL
ncbi:MAG: lytic transglycosylase domain-containing protein [Candidatus Competibacteraceae bacterium]|nr:MAG: lytic transglycosylase domain-containing protein [Candidatus Competibacteraceae bacterium]